LVSTSTTSHRPIAAGSAEPGDRRTRRSRRSR
jgi:hypothetical protein